MMIAMIGSIALLLPERAQCRAAAGEADIALASRTVRPGRTN